VNNDAISVDKTPIEQAQSPLYFKGKQPDGQTFHQSMMVKGSKRVVARVT
jgi:hypothetical protein